MLKVLTVVGTRPEIIRLSRVIDKLDRYCEHTLVHTGQNYDYELNEVFFSDLGIRRPDHFLEAAGATAAETIGQVIIAADKILETLKPDALLLLGDTNSALAAIAAKRRKVPIFHMEAGNRCFDFRVPEEINRRIVDHISDINLTYSEIAREYLLREGLPPDQVIKTGSPMREVIEHYQGGINASDVLTRLNLSAGHYFVVSSHREENVDSPEQLRKLIEMLSAIARRYDEPVIVSTHPRTRKRMDALGLQADPRVQFLKPFGFLDYIKLQTNARAVLSDSGTITEESSILNFPALNLREVHERPEGFEEAAVMFVGMNVDRAMQALDILASQPRGEERALRLVTDYEPDNVSDKVLRIIVSYADFVKRRVWRLPG
ncbi:non-hydrolyzing UDP-N-acetylglucosamine 2-epimerase [Cupriavidus pinatubonensis]|uniref:non-hydrolyzing UDP-N-acetylglucosamine 2-epimerase n=1 Tax=Cupriavidus pinatubonensis TaxID=248026 RepID=UPI00112BF6DC|nr:UDP-N-acetylglucosamine 2-epimerase (non-hydrolyzing) [Cupriavidus pinatubonensis]TPQ39610.1 UDP-N-acetylglucosamine 2-epimerase (non-hydrolyzing) [Cupriavidus pinatubonensis]